VSQLAGLRHVCFPKRRNADPNSLAGTQKKTFINMASEHEHVWQAHELFSTLSTCCVPAPEDDASSCTTRLINHTELGDTRTYPQGTEDKRDPLYWEPGSVQRHTNQAKLMKTVHY
jgi:hypothetical protein